MALVLVALLMVAILSMVAIVIDLGQARASRRNDQTVADLASLAAGFFLSGRGSSTVLSSPRSACEAAIISVETNIAGFSPSPGAVAACAPLPADALGNCGATTPPADRTVNGGDYRLVIRYPVPDSEIAEPRFTGGVGARDGSNRCERMKVILTHVNHTAFAGIVGADTVTTTASAVVRADNTRLARGVAALLLLERVGCGSLQTSGGGSGGPGVTVLSSSPLHPGVIQADSAGMLGVTAPVVCTSNENAGGYVVYGNPLPSAGGGGPSIVAGTSSGGLTGVIGIYALNVGGRGGAVYPGGLSDSPLASIITSRQPADDKYNKTSVAGGQIRDLHRRGYLGTTGATTGYAVITGSDCSSMATGNPLPSATQVFVDCPTFSPDALIFPSATTVVFGGKLDIANNRVLSLPRAQHVFVRGCTSSCTGGNDFGVSVAGTLLVNTGETTIPAPADGGTTCAARAGPGSNPAGSTTNWTEFATFGGPFRVTGLVRLCQTSLYLGADTPTYARQAVTVTGGSYPATAQCGFLPCPTSSSNSRGFITFGGGQGTLRPQRGRDVHRPSHADPTAERPTPRPLAERQQPGNAVPPPCPRRRGAHLGHRSRRDHPLSAARWWGTPAAPV